MKSIKLSFREKKEMDFLNAKYLKKDFYLIVDLADTNELPFKRVSTKNLTFCWDENNSDLLSIEGYNNMQNWQIKSLPSPKVSEFAGLYCNIHFDENNIASSFDNISERWIFDENLKLLLIEFNDFNVAKRVRVAKNLVIGVNKIFELAELWIEELSIE